MSVVKANGWGQRSSGWGGRVRVGRSSGRQAPLRSQPVLGRAARGGAVSVYIRPGTGHRRLPRSLGRGSSRLRHGHQRPVCQLQEGGRRPCAVRTCSAGSGQASAGLTGVRDRRRGAPEAHRARADRAPGPLPNSVQGNDSPSRRFQETQVLLMQPVRVLRRDLVSVCRPGGERVLAFTFLR